MTSYFEKHLRFRWEIYKHKSGKYFDIIQANENYNWPWKTILLGTILDNAINKIDIIRKYMDKGLDWDSLTRYIAQSNITDIIANKDLPWNMNILSFSKDISWDIIINNLDISWNWKTLSYNFTITPDIILANSQYQWNWDVVSEKNNISIDMLTKYIHLPWNWDILTNNMCISFKDKLKHKDLPWNWNCIPLNYYGKLSREYMTLICIDYPELSWNWKMVSCNIDIKYIDIVIQNKHLPWDWDIISNKIKCYTIYDGNLVDIYNIILDNCDINWVYVQIFDTSDSKKAMVKLLMSRIKNGRIPAKYINLVKFLGCGWLFEKEYIKICKIQYNYLARYIAHNNILIMNIFNYSVNTIL